MRKTPTEILSQPEGLFYLAVITEDKVLVRNWNYEFECNDFQALKRWMGQFDDIRVLIVNHNH